MSSYNATGAKFDLQFLVIHQASYIEKKTLFSQLIAFAPFNFNDSLESQPRRTLLSLSSLRMFSIEKSHFKNARNG